MPPVAWYIVNTAKTNSWFNYHRMSYIKSVTSYHIYNTYIYNSIHVLITVTTFKSWMDDNELKIQIKNYGFWTKIT